MIDGVVNADALPVLERVMQFAGERHRLITNNIANLSTPGYRATDLDVEAFQRQLREAVDVRRETHGNAGGELVLQDIEALDFHDDRLEARPSFRGDNLLFHDGNDRDLERTMQGLVENFLTFRSAAQFMRSRFELINTAIRERV